MSRQEINDYTDWLIKNFQPFFPKLGKWLKIGDKTKKNIFYKRINKFI